MEVRKVTEEQEIWNEKEKVAKSEKEVKKLIPQRFYKQIYVFDKKASERIPTRKLQGYTIETNKLFVLRKEKVYLLSREEREEVCKFISKQFRKRYIRSLRLSQIALVFYAEKKNRRKFIVQDYRYLNEWTIKNNYSLSSILDIIENIGIKKVFTKIDL